MKVLGKVNGNRKCPKGKFIGKHMMDEHNCRVQINEWNPVCNTTLISPVHIYFQELLYICIYNL